jgi:two-component system, OmpR family, heavy metal sensor histidine kinase CusS
MLRRLTLLYAVSSFLMLVLAAACLNWSLGENLEREANAFLANKIEDCRRLLLERPNDTPLLVNEVQTEAASSQFIRYYVRLLDDQGNLVLETPGMTELLPAALFPAAIETTASPSRGTLWKSPAGRSYLLMPAWAQINTTGHLRRLIQVALEVSADESLMARYRMTLAAVVVLGMLFSAGAGLLIARKGLLPLKEITETTERITASQLRERIVTNGWPDELASLACSFDRMLDRLEVSFQRLSQFSADLAHELRTPINNLWGEAGVALSQCRTSREYRATLESSLEEYARLARLIDNLLFLARADGQTEMFNREPCNAREAIEVVREFYEALAEDRGVEVRCEGEGMVNADPVLFRQAISNLLSNALNYTPSGGRVLIQIHDSGDNGLKVDVSDTGCGIAAEHLPRIFDRLYRVDPARSQHPNGAGLGLAIVRSIMTLHGGSVEVQSEPGKGTTFRLSFPAISSDSTAKLTKM